MSQQKENSTNAQASSELNTEAAIRLVPQTSLKTTKKEPILKDGEDPPEPPSVTQFLVEVALNGFVVTISYDDMDVPDAKYVVQTMDEVFELMRSNF